MNLSDEFHRKADETNNVNDHDELHAAGMVLHLDTVVGGLLMEQEYVRRWVKNLAERHGIKTRWNWNRT